MNKMIECLQRVAESGFANKYYYINGYCIPYWINFIL